MSTGEANLHVNLTIGELARFAEVNVETIRFYQRKGLMPEPVRPSGGIRRYNSEDSSRLHFIKSAKGLGFNLAEIAQLLQLDDGTSCSKARRLAEIKLEDVRGKLAELARLENALDSLIKLCGMGSGKVRCPLIAAMSDEPL